MSEIKFVDGLRVFSPHENAPDFVIANIKITRKELGNWLRNQAEDEIKVDIKRGKTGKYYAAVNDWKPNQEQTSQTNEPAPSNGFDDDIPF